MDTKNIVQDVKSWGQSKTFKTVIVVLCVLLAVLFIFQAGVFVGFHKANFSNGWGDNYSKTFGQLQRGGMMGGFQNQNVNQNGFGMWNMMGLTDQNGVVGKIVSINLPTIVVSGQDGVEKAVLIKDDTIVRQFRDNVDPSVLKAGDIIVVFGVANDQSQIEAKLIRIMPAGAPTSMMGRLNDRI